MKRFAIQLSLVFLLALSTLPLSAQNGAMHIEFPLVTDPNAPNMYAACIDDRIGIDATVRETFQFVQTPSGHVHVVSNWSITGTASGLDSGWNWFVHGTSPLVVNAQGQQRAQTIRVNIMLEPLEDGPRLLGRERIDFIVNANGVVQIADIESTWTCLGAPQ
ncbi:MAG: hypothetical protein R3212_01265 [Xanthomonadales bacterium]|nr:hypothetical protein [Xanthomonadales bacterium]